MGDGIYFTASKLRAGMLLWVGTKAITLFPSPGLFPLNSNQCLAAGLEMGNSEAGGDLELLEGESDSTWKKP